jgi:hypothetical protein
MQSRLRLTAWAGLLAIAAVHVWSMVDQWLFIGIVPTRGYETQWFWVAFFIFWPWLDQPLTVIGFWLLCDIRTRGSGRWFWRWWVGGYLASYFLWLVYSLPNWLGPNVYNITGAHPLVEAFADIAAIWPIWVLTAPRRPRRGADLKVG